METNIHDVEKVVIQRRYFDGSGNDSGRKFHTLVLEVTNEKGERFTHSFFSKDLVKFTDEVKTKKKLKLVLRCSDENCTRYNKPLTKRGTCKGVDKVSGQ